MWGEIRFTSTGESHGKWDLVYKVSLGWVGEGGGGGLETAQMQCFCIEGELIHLKDFASILQR